jgi:nucleotide-binding universal stress UspA family protein
MEVFMYKSILVPLDGSKRAEAILPHIENLCRLSGCKVIFLIVVEDFPTVGFDEAVDWRLFNEDCERLKRESESYLTGLERTFRQKNIETEKRIVQGPVVKMIIETAANESADLIAMASHGRSGLSRTFYGSVAAGVLQRVDRPLLLIRSESG